MARTPRVTPIKSNIKKTVSTERVKNGFLINVETNDDKGHWNTEKFIAKTKKEATELAAKKLG